MQTYSANYFFSDMYKSWQQFVYKQLLHMPRSTDVTW